MVRSEIRGKTHYTDVQDPLPEKERPTDGDQLETRD